MDPGAGVVREPVARADQARLRRLVVELKAAERRGRFPAVFHVGGPGRPEVGRCAEPLDPSGSRLDQALRCDLLEAVLRRAPPGPVMTWLTRPGDLEDQDLDLAWLRVVVTVNGETGRALPYLVVTREGWRDPRSGVSRRWLRVRDR